jgi:hypothetical protein
MSSDSDGDAVKFKGGHVPLPLPAAATLDWPAVGPRPLVPLFFPRIPLKPSGRQVARKQMLL